jgi:hypothetical protein
LKTRTSIFGVRAQRGDLLVPGYRLAVIDKDANAHPSIGRAQRRIGQQAAGIVGAKDEVLKVQRSLGGVGHLRPRQKAIDPR